MRTVNATEFKAKCLRLLDEVAETGEGITVTKRGTPVATVFPIAGREELELYPQETLAGTFEITGDILSPPLPPEAWDAERGEWEP
jgi:prevent-host-death family protein